MADFDERPRKILDGYANFLREKELALPKHQPYLVRWQGCSDSCQRLSP